MKFCDHRLCQRSMRAVTSSVLAGLFALLHWLSATADGVVGGTVCVTGLSLSLVVTVATFPTTVGRSSNSIQQLFYEVEIFRFETPPMRATPRHPLTTHRTENLFPRGHKQPASSCWGLTMTADGWQVGVALSLPEPRTNYQCGQ